jgi:hypothetical protein
MELMPHWHRKMKFKEQAAALCGQSAPTGLILGPRRGQGLPSKQIPKLQVPLLALN